MGYVKSPAAHRSAWRAGRSEGGHGGYVSTSPPAPLSQDRWIVLRAAIFGQLRSADGPLGYPLVSWEVMRAFELRTNRKPKEVSTMREIEIKPVPVKREERRTSAFNKK